MTNKLERNLSDLIVNLHEVLLNERAMAVKITAKQKEVLLRSAMLGQKDKEIAFEMDNTSVQNIQKHKSKLKKKLGVNDFNQVIRIAMKYGIID